MSRVRFPSEWEPHTATWIAWPHHEPDWPGKLAAIGWVYAEIVRALHRRERVEIVCADAAVRASAAAALGAHGVDDAQYGLHVQAIDRSWLRDTAPTAVLRDGMLSWCAWGFNAWAKYPNFSHDAKIGGLIADVSGAARHVPQRPDGCGPVVLEGGGLETDGEGTLLVTEEWLLSSVQVRNPSLGRDDYERIFRDELGIDKTIWLGQGCVGDDTHGHVDDIARFVAPHTLVVAHEPDPADENHRRSSDNLERLAGATDAARRPVRVVTLPFPRPVMMDGQRLPASYANFYIANGVVLVPTFNDPNDRAALNTLAGLMPDHQIVGIHSVDLVWGLGAIHCLTQQQPVASRGRWGASGHG